MGVVQCTGCGRAVNPEDVNAAGQCVNCGPADGELVGGSAEPADEEGEA